MGLQAAIGRIKDMEVLTEFDRDNSRVAEASGSLMRIGMWHKYLFVCVGAGIFVPFFVSSQEPSATFVASGSYAGFPMKQGSHWKYRCHTQHKEAEAPHYLTTSFSWKMEILDVQHHGEITTAVVNGYLADVRDHPDGHTHQNYLMVRVADSKYYLIPPPESEVLLSTLHDKSAENLIAKADPFLELPLVTGRGFRTEQAEQGKRMRSGSHAPGFDSWLVQEQRKITLQNVKGDIPKGPVSEYKLIYGLNKSEIELGFVPGIGIDTYRYNGYSGVPPQSREWDGHCELIEYHH